jgi:ribosomal protein S1
MALYECELGDNAQKKAAFDALKLGSVVTGTIIRKGDTAPTALRLSVRQYKQDENDRQRRVSREREQTEKDDQLAALVAANAENGVVSGTITSKESYGVFVQVSPRWRALLHVAELCGSRPQNDRRLAELKIGERVEGVLSVKEEPGQPVKLSLSTARAEDSKRQAKARNDAEAEAFLASLAVGAEFTGTVYYDLGSQGLDGTDVGLILEHKHAHFWLHERELGVDPGQRHTIKTVAVRFAGLDADHDDMPIVVRAGK